MGHINTVVAKKAVAKLKQARRCEQFGHRLGIMMRNGETVAHVDLNKQAIRNILQATLDDDAEDWEIAFAEKLNTNVEKQCRNTLLIASLHPVARKQVSRAT